MRTTAILLAVLAGCSSSPEPIEKRDVVGAKDPLATAPVQPPEPEPVVRAERKKPRVQSDASNGSDMHVWVDDDDVLHVEQRSGGNWNGIHIQLGPDGEEPTGMGFSVIQQQQQIIR